jgi:preprotein translocase subunit SecD
LDGSYVYKSYVQTNKDMGACETMIVFSEEGTKLWEDLTANNVNRHLAIVLDGEVYSYPKIMDKISGGKAMISGNFTHSEAEQLAALIQGGKLPLEFKIKVTE